jgi:hypothetical protein
MNRTPSDCDVCGKPSDTVRVIEAYGIETGACASCRGVDDDDERVVPVITSSEWRVKRRLGYASVINGQKYVLALEPLTGATILQPVTVSRS